MEIIRELEKSGTKWKRVQLRKETLPGESSIRTKRIDKSNKNTAKDDHFSV